MEDVTSFTASIGQLPFNFRLGNNRHKHHVLPAQTEWGELQVKLDHCNGPIVGNVTLPKDVKNHTLTDISGALEKTDGIHDLCLQFTAHTIDPFWVIDWFKVVK